MLAAHHDLPLLGQCLFTDSGKQFLQFGNLKRLHYMKRMLSLCLGGFLACSQIQLVLAETTDTLIDRGRYLVALGGLQ